MRTCSTLFVLQAFPIETLIVRALPTHVECGHDDGAQCDIVVGAFTETFFAEFLLQA